MEGDEGRDGETLLTPREAEVLSLLREGRTNAEIAGRLGITLDGAKYHISQIIGKLGVRNRYEAARWPERSPWWVGAFAPLALVWRKARVVAPPKLSALALGASAVVLVVVLAGAAILAFLLASGGGGEQPQAVQEPVNTVELASGEAGWVELETPEVSVGQSVVVNGLAWEGIGPLRFYLVAGEFEAGTRSIMSGDAPKLGEAAIRGDGSATFSFVLASSYGTPGGERFRVQPGQRFYIFVFQDAGGRASHGSATGPLTVR